MKKFILVLLLFCGMMSVSYSQNKVAIFAGGCFWCMQADFDKLPGVLKTTVGYDGGTSKKPTYQTVSAGQTNYAESIQVIYNPKIISYKKLLFYFWRNVDPTALNAQFCDHGKQYRSAIFYLNAEQKKSASISLRGVRGLFNTVYTQVVPSTHFYPAEAYHQKYYKKNPIRYKYYRWNCGRDARLKSVWGNKRLKNG